MKLPSLSFLVQAFVCACRRFPLTMLFAVLGTLRVMADIEYTGPQTVDTVWMALQIGLPLSLGIGVLAESLGWRWWHQALLQAAGIGLLTWYALSLDPNAPAWEQVHWPRFNGFLLAAHLLVAMAPYLNRSSIADFWEYNKRLFANFIIGAAYTLILYAGLALAVLAVNELFNLHIDNKIYLHLFVVLAGVFNTSFFLYHFPAAFQFGVQERSYNVVFKNLCQYILIPIVGLYFLILYAYSIKILVTWNLPHGWVSSLVLGFSVAGIFTYLINYLLPEHTDNKIVGIYRRWFWWVLLPMIVLLFVAIGRRISDYGVTENRFFVAHAGLWLLVMCVYFLRSKTDNIKFIPISLALFTLVAVLGPFSAFQVAKRSQTGILHQLLEENGRFDGEKLKPGGAQITGPAADRIVSCLNFLEDRGALDHVAPWLPIPLQALPDADKAYNESTKLAAWLAIDFDARTGNPRRFSQLISVSPERPANQLDITGYRTFYRLEIYDSRQRQDSTQDYFDLSKDQKALVWKKAGGQEEIDRFDLTPKLEAWKAAAQGKHCALPAGAESFELRGAKSSVLLTLQSARFNATTMKVEEVYGLLFVK